METEESLKLWMVRFGCERLVSKDFIFVVQVFM